MITEVDFFSRIRTQLDRELPMVVYRKPGERDVRLMTQTTTEDFNGEMLNTPGFVFAPFDTLSNPLFIAAEDAEVIEFKYQGKPFEKVEHISPQEPMPAHDNQVQVAHEKLVQRTIDHIKSSEIEKIVLARTEKTKVHDPDPVPILKRLLDRYDEALVYLWYHPTTGIWMGATPETLLKAERNRFTTMALAGTKLYEEGKRSSWRKKEMEEQAIVTGYMEKQLQKLNEVKNLKVGKPYDMQAGNLLHLRTDLQGELDSSGSLLKVVTALHPTPAVCGMPKAEALQYILENEKMNREFYTGYLGEVQISEETKRNSNRRNQENQQFAAISRVSHLFVNLRCMKLDQDVATIYVGGGITKASNAAEEWFETVNKAETIRRALVK